MTLPPASPSSSEARLAFLAGLAHATRGLRDPRQVMQTTARMLGEHLAASRCAYAHMGADENHFELVGDHNVGVPSIVGHYALSDFGEDVLRLHLQGKPYVNHDVERDPRTAGTDLSAYRSTCIRSVISVPLLKEGRFVAGMAVHQSEPRVWRDDEIELVALVVDRCWETLDRMRSEAALREMNHRLSLALAAGGLGDWSWDARTDAVSFSDAAVQLFQLPSPEGITWAGLRERLHPDDREPARQAVETALETRRPYVMEYRLMLDGGGERWIAARGMGTYDDQGQVIGMIGVVQDVTDRRAAAAEKQRLLDETQRLAEERSRALDSERAARNEVERASAIKDEFLATVSHELRAPLSAIIGWAHILRRQLDAHPPAMLKGVDVIERNARLQAKLIDDLLDTSRIVSGKMYLARDPVRPGAFVAAAVETVRPAAEQAGVRLDVELEPIDAVVVGDAGRLQQVVWNLLTNAVKFSPRGGGVSVRLQGLADDVRLVVRDQGVGIEPELLPRLFERFRQADSSRTRQFAGLGLGLSIVKQLVEMHGGRVQAASAGKGQGAEFTVWLPLAKAGAAAAAGAGPHEGLTALPGLRVLAVDDEADVRDVLQRVLEDMGAVVSTAGSAAEAMDCLCGMPAFDVMVSDIGMPQVDGFQLMRQVRALRDRHIAAIPSIALTAYTRPEDRERALEAGFDLHVAKPLEPLALARAIQAVVGQQSAARAALGR